MIRQMMFIPASESVEKINKMLSELADKGRSIETMEFLETANLIAITFLREEK